MATHYPTEKLKKWDEFIEPRLELLYSNGYYIEALYLCLPLIEELIKTAIKKQEVWASRILKISNLDFKIDLEKLDDLTLGQLIKRLDKHCKDKVLILKLNDLNLFRKRIVHKLLDHEIKQTNI